MMMSMDQPRTSLRKRAFLLAGFSVCNIEKLGGLGGELRAHESGTCLNNIMWNKVYGDRFFYFCFLLFFFQKLEFMAALNLVPPAVLEGK